ncbi:hypothetical protein [Xenophilus sp.]|uniref:hypothetical protein n=1 Tax=Xenophilus sp. TaxID=1873499 RepID=UPI0037DDCFC1
MSDRGILDTLPAVYAVEAVRQLPHPAADGSERATAVLDVPGVGQVRFTFERRRQMMPKPGPWFWGVCYAEMPR